jgi:acyl-CoA reductase-like NAD-dependent aldehyde dehydrogenase
MMSTVFLTTSPADFSPLPNVQQTTVEDLASAIQKARAAQGALAQQPAALRESARHEFSKRLLTRSAEAERVMSSETGRSQTECLWSELVAFGDWAEKMPSLSWRIVL